MKKIVCKVVCFSVCLVVASSLFLFGFSNMETAYASMGKIIVEECENGNFEKVPSVYSIFRSKTTEISTIGVNSEVYKEIGLENYYINVDSNTFMPVTKTIYFANDVSNRSQQTVLSSEGIARVNDFYENKASTEVSLTIYSNSLSSGYIGYGGKTYYQEIFVFSENVGTEKLIRNNANLAIQYVEKLANGLSNLVFIGGAFVQRPLLSLSVSAISTLVEKVANQWVESSATFIHKARMLEAKTIKSIYMISSHTGSLAKYSEVQKTQYQYDNLFDIRAGFGSFYQGYKTNFEFAEAPTYFRAEEMAYNSMMSSGGSGYFYFDPILQYKYCDIVFQTLR